MNSIPALYDLLPGHEKIIVDMLRQLIREHLPAFCREKLSYGVPLFYGHRSICIIWPSTIPRGGIREGVLLGFWYGSKINDEDNYLVHGTNKQVYYRVYRTPEEIDADAIIKLLGEAVKFDAHHPARHRSR